MVTRVVIYTYDHHSEGGLELRQKLAPYSAYKEVGWCSSESAPPSFAAKDNLLICWGKVPAPYWKVPWSITVLNSWAHNAIKANKLAAFKAMTHAGVPTVEWSTHPDTAQKWATEGHVVMVRHKIGSQDSAGIEVLKAVKSFYGHKACKSVPSAKLYTKYIPQAREFRVHCTPKYFIDGLEKKKGPKSNPYIFHQNTGLFCRDGVLIPQVAIDAAKAAVAACKLDFGAVDLLWAGGKPYILEVNTAPGLLPSEAGNYARVLHKHGYV